MHEYTILYLQSAENWGMMHNPNLKADDFCNYNSHTSLDDT